jgi:hypothetical protein
VVAENWWSSWMPAVAPYAILLRLFIDGRMGADEFEVLFLRLYKLDPTDWSPELFEILDRFFADVDDFCGDDSIRQEVQGLDEATLRNRAGETIDALARIVG